MMMYLVKSASCLALLLIFYHLILEREKMHQFNRFYLLGSVLFSFIAPLGIIYIQAPPTPEVAMTILETPIAIDNTVLPAVEESVNYYHYLLTFSLLISGILSIRFFRNLYAIYKKIHFNERIAHQNAVLVLVDDAISPHTFWNYIFINKEEYQTKNIEQELFTHELTHVTQRHTLDVLLIETLKIIFWFNPIFYFLKKSIQLNHEFLADNQVVSAHKNISEYQYLLLNKAAWNNDYYLASNLNYSLTKKRLVMMTTQSSKSKMLLKKLAVIPLAAGFAFLFAERVEAQTSTNQATDAQLQEYQTLMEKKEKDEDTYNRLVEIHDAMNEEQKESVTSISALLPKFSKDKTLDLKIKKRKISKSLFNNLQNGKKYAIWLNGKRIQNKVLKQYKYTDIASYQMIYSNKEVRSKSPRLLQEYHYILYTKAYAQKLNKSYLKDTLPEVREIRATKAQMAAYQRLFKKLKSQKNYRRAEINKLRALYTAMSRQQQRSVTKYSLLLPPPPPPAYVTSIIVKAKAPTKLQMRTWSTSKTYGLWIDGKNVSNSNLKKYKHTDFALYATLKLRRSGKNYGKKYQLKLYTHAYHKRVHKGKQVLPPPPPRRGSSKAEIEKYKKAYNTWAKLFKLPPKPPKPPKPVKIEKMKKAKKVAVTEIIEEQPEVIEVIEEQPEVVKEITEIKENSSMVDVIEIPRGVRYNQGLTLDKIEELTEEEIIAESGNGPRHNIIYYYNGKKINKKKVDALLKAKKIKTLSVVRNDDGSQRVNITGPK